MKTLSMLAAGSMLLLGSAARADLIGIVSIQSVEELQIDGDPFTDGPTALYDIWRIYAEFDDPTDRLTQVSGNIATAHAMEFSTSYGFFYNFVFARANNTIPSPVTGTPEEMADSWLEIGRTDALVGVATNQTPAFPPLGNAISTFTVTDGAYFRTPDDTLTIAGADQRVILAQLTVLRHAQVKGLVRLAVDTASTPGGATISNITFNIGPPSCVMTNITGTNAVDTDDLLAVINDWGCELAGPPFCRGDVNGDGRVDVDDVLRIIDDWGPCAGTATEPTEGPRREEPSRPQEVRRHPVAPGPRAERSAGP